MNMPGLTLNMSHWEHRGINNSLSRMGFSTSSRQLGIPKPTIHRLDWNKYATDDIKQRGGPFVLPKEVEDELVGH